MKRFLLHFSLASAVTLLTLALSPPPQAQPADQDAEPAAPYQADAAPVQQAQQNEAQMPASGDTTTQEAKTFTGLIVKENGDFVLKDPVTKVTYKLSDPAKVKQLVGKRVKVTGKLDMSNNTIEVANIEPLS